MKIRMMWMLQPRMRMLIIQRYMRTGSIQKKPDPERKQISMNREQEMVSIACKAIDDKKALDIKVIDIREVSVIADYFVIASGSNLNQVQAIVDNVEEQLGRAGFEPKQIEGTRNSNWILMDYGDLIIHVFDEENRLFYDLERIWRDGKELDTSEFLK